MKLTLQEVQVKIGLAGSLVIISFKNSVLKKNTPSRDKIRLIYKKRRTNTPMLITLRMSKLYANHTKIFLKLGD